MMKKLLPLLIAGSLAGGIQMVSADNNTSATATDAAVNVNKEQQSAYSWLGVAIQPVPMALANQLSGQIKDNQGIMVRSVHPQSPAAKAGVEPFDVISGFNEQEIFTTEQFSRLIRSSKPGTVIKLHLIRQSKPQTLDVTLDAQPGMQPRRTQAQRSMPYPQSRHGRYDNMMPSDFGYHHPPSLPRKFHPPVTHRQSYSWSEFESVQVESMGNDKYKATVKYDDSDGNVQNFVFEGKLDEINTQIMSHKTLPESKKRTLLQALDMNNMAPPMLNPWQPMPDPEWFRQNQLPVPPWYRGNNW